MLFVEDKLKDMSDKDDKASLILLRCFFPTPGDMTLMIILWSSVRGNTRKSYVLQECSL